MDPADDLLQRALLDAEACASVALKVSDLPLSEALTVIFHGRRGVRTRGARAAPRPCVALEASGLPPTEARPVICPGRGDLGTLQTYVAHGGRAAGSAV